MTEPHVRSRLESRGITLMPVEPDWIREVDRIIFEELAAARVVRDSQRKLKTLITELAKQKVQAVVLGCTSWCLRSMSGPMSFPCTTRPRSTPKPRSSGCSPKRKSRALPHDAG